MIRRILIATLLTALPVLVIAQSKASAPATVSAPSIDGVWRIAQSIVTGANASENSAPQPSLIMFDHGYYSYLLIRGTAPRPLYALAKDPANMTDAEKVARYTAFDAFSGNSGTYEIAGNVLLRSPMVAKSPYTMSVDPPMVQEMKWEGAALWLTSTTDAGQPSSETRVKLVRMPAATAVAPSSGLTGTWRLNLAKSKYDPPTSAPQKSTSSITVTPHMVMYRSDGVNANGQVTHGEWLARLDGKDYPQRNTVNGQINPKDVDAVNVRRIDANTYEFTNKRQNEALTISRIVVSADARSRTTTVTGKTIDGRIVHHTIVWDRQ